MLERLTEYTEIINTFLKQEWNDETIILDDANDMEALAGEYHVVVGITLKIEEGGGPGTLYVATEGVTGKWGPCFILHRVPIGYDEYPDLDYYMNRIPTDTRGSSLEVYRWLQENSNSTIIMY